MRKIFIPFILLSSSHFATAQNVGVGQTTPLNRLHVTATTDPLRLDGLQSGASTDSIVTVNSTGVIRKRTLAAVTGGTGWSITGNAGTSASTNFLGTSDFISLVIRTNNQRAGFIDADSTKRNNSIGNRAMSATITGISNNAFGSFALRNLTSGIANIAIGDSSAYNIQGGSTNISIGKNALFTANASTGNIAIGSNTLQNTVSSENIAIGNNAAQGNNVGSNIVAIGANALQANQTTATHLAIGNNSLKLLTGGLENVAIGYNTGTSLTTGQYNVLVGNYALGTTTNSNNNTIVGHNAALAYTGTGNNNNTFVGYETALTQTSGSGNTFIGYAIDVAPVSSSFSNSTGLGQGVQITASNQVRVGNSSVNSIGGQVGWTTFSDERIKKNISEDVPGLSFITLLRPVTYNYDYEKLMQLQTGKNITLVSSDNPNSGNRFSGFLAQQVETAAKSVNYNFSGIDKPANEHTPYGIRYAEMVVPLVKAVQELKIIIDKQQQEIEALKAQLKKQ